MNVIKYIFLAITVTFLLNCKKDNRKEVGVETKIIDHLIFKANDIDRQVNYRLRLADSIHQLLRKDKLDSISKINYKRLYEIYLTLNNDQKFFEVCNELLMKSEKINDFELSGDTYYSIANYYNYNVELDSALIYFSKAEKKFNMLPENKYKEYILLSKANLLFITNNYIDSESLAIEGLKSATKNKNFRLIYNSYLTIGNSLTGLKNYDKATQYYSKAIQITNKLKDKVDYTELVAYANNYVGGIYQKQGLHQKAIEIFSKTLLLDDFKKMQSPIYCYLTNNLNYSKLKLGDKTVINKFEETLKIGGNIGSIPVQITSKHYMGEYFLMYNDTLQAIKYLKEAQHLAIDNNFFDDELKILPLLAKVNHQKENFYNQRYIFLADSLHDVERISRDKYARIEYESDQLTLEKNSVENQKNKIFTQFLLFAGISAILLLILGLLLHNKNKTGKLQKLVHKQQHELDDVQIYNLIQTNQQKIEEGKRLEKHRISRDLHDGVIGKLSAIRMNLYEIKHNQSQETLQNHLQHINKMRAIEEEIRNLTHELNSNVFSDAVSFETMIKILFDEINKDPKIKFELVSDSRINWELISNPIKMNLYRVFQEAIQNINKYAAASEIKITIVKNKNGISIQIYDNGKGFIADNKSLKNGIGIKNMKYRIEELQGQFSLHSIKNEGTKINLVIPVQNNIFEI